MKNTSKKRMSVTPNMDHLIGLRVELTHDIERHRAGERGVVGECRGYIGVVMESAAGLLICHDKQPITNFLRIIDDEREPEPIQMKLWED